MKNVIRKINGFRLKKIERKNGNIFDFMLLVLGILVIGYLEYNRMEMYDVYLWLFLLFKMKLYKNKFYFMLKVGYIRISFLDVIVKLFNRFVMNLLNIIEYLIK